MSLIQRRKWVRTPFPLQLPSPLLHAAELLRCNECFAHPVSAYANAIIPDISLLRGSFLTVSGASLAAIKQAEDENGIILRLYNPENTAAEARLLFPGVIKSAETVSISEHSDAGACLPAGNLLTVKLAALRNFFCARLLLILIDHSILF